jgi:hypothetical protein
MRILLAIFGVLGLALFAFSLANMRSDIQVILAAIGLFSALILFGLSEILRTMKR